MRSRLEIEADGKRVDLLILEVLLDIRDILQKQAKLLKPNRANKIRSV